MRLRTWAARLAPLLAWLAAATTAHAAAPDWTELADGVRVLHGRFERNRQPDGNSLLLLGREGWVLLDSGRHREHAEALDRAVQDSGRPLRAIVNTHWHLDHVGGNALLRERHPAAAVLGSAALQDAVLRRMPRSQADLAWQREDPALDAATRDMIDIDLALYERRLAFLPTQLVKPASQELKLAGRPVRVGVASGPTRGDLWLLDLQSGLLAVGDFLTWPVPFLDTACPSAWKASLDALAELPFQRVLPGHGPLLDRSGFERYRQAFGRLLSCAAGPATEAECAAGWIDDLGPLLPGELRRSVAPMLGYYLKHTLRADTATLQERCNG